MSICIWIDKTRSRLPQRGLSFARREQMPILLLGARKPKLGARSALRGPRFHRTRRLALGREIGSAARFRGSPTVVVNTEPGGGRVDGLSDSHDSAERAVRRERVPRREGHPFVHQFYSVGAPRGVEPLTS